jgi:hypothetical protein
VVKHVIAELAMKRTFGAAALGLGLLAVTATAQDMMRHVDLTSPDMVSADMTRADVEAALAAATVAAPADFTGKRLSSLDLSGLDLSGAIFRAARAVKTMHLIKSTSVRLAIVGRVMRGGGRLRFRDIWRAVGRRIMVASRCVPRLQLLHRGDD